MDDRDQSAAVVQPDRRMAFRAAAALLMPAEAGRHGVIVEASADWDLTEGGLPASADVVVWGRLPLLGGTPPAAVARSAAARERALARLRRRAPAPLELVAVRRLAPATLRPPCGAQRLRTALLSGALVEFAAPPRHPSVLDTVAAAAGAEGGVRRFRPGTGGQGLAEITLASGLEAILRAAPSGAVDPAHAGDALESLAAVGGLQVPRLLGRGHTAGVSWTVESRLAGHRPRRLTPRLLADVARFCAALPRTAGPPAALAEDLERIAMLLPDRGGVARRLAAQAAPALATLRGVLRHGDLWAGNLLCEGEAVTGIVDWDAWHPQGLPGADLAQLLGTEHRIRRHLALGAAWRERPWRVLEDPAWSAYWRALELEPSPEMLDLIGLAWWASEAAGTLRRLPHRAADERWLAANVDPILAEFAL